MGCLESYSGSSHELTFTKSFKPGNSAVIEKKPLQADLNEKKVAQAEENKEKVEKKVVKKDEEEKKVEKIDEGEKKVVKKEEEQKKAVQSDSKKVVQSEYDDEIAINEKALVNEDNKEPVIFSSYRNDIRHISKVEIQNQASYISKISIEKLLQRKKVDDEVKKIAFSRSEFHNNLMKHLEMKADLTN